MKSRSTITILLVLVMTSSIFVGSTTPTTNTESLVLGVPQTPQTIAGAPSISPPHILVYTEYLNTSAGGEYEKTMTAINNTYGTDYQLTALVNFTLLDILLPGKDILLIPEQEYATVTKMKNVGTYWTSTLTTWVHDGGVIVMLDFGSESAPGLGLHIYNQSGLMKFGPVLGQYPSADLSLMHRHTFGDPLARRVEYTWTPRDHTFAVKTSDGVNAFDDYDTDSRVCVHKSMGKGHVVFLGFDMSDADANYEQIVGNAIRLTNYVIIDDAQNTEATWEFPPPHVDGFALGPWVDDMVEDGFAVGRMDNLVNATLLNACEVFICPIPYWTDDYSPSEIAIINNYVTNGGSVFLFSDWGSYGDDIRGLVQSFGYEWRRDVLYDTDNYVTSDDSRILYEGANIISHSITTGVNRVELYASDGFTTLPGNSEILIQSDFDNTTFWSSDDTNADGVATMAVSTYGSGRVAVILDTNIFNADENIDGDSSNNYLDSDHSLLLMNTLRWLASDATANTPPTINSLEHTPLVPLSGDSVTVIANVNDTSGIDNVTCYYRMNYGSWTTVTMSPDVGDDFIATIGSFEETTVVDYYVRAFDNSTDKLESVSSVGSFTVFNQLPDIPVLNDPGALDDDGVFLLNWTESHDADGYIDHYEVQMDDTGTFSALLGSWSVPTNETWINVFTNGTYYFRVKALDDHGEYAGFSNVVSIEVGIPEDLASPVIASLFTDPASPMHGEGVTVKADVLDSTGIDNVTCSYSINSGTWYDVVMTNVYGDRYEAYIGTFSVDDTVYISVQAWDNSSHHNGRVSAFSFVIENQAPLAPDLLDPGTTISFSHFIANWTEAFDQEGAIDHYQLQVSISSEFATLFGVWNTTDLSFNVTGLSNGVYYLRVRAIDDHDAVSSWSNVESIEIELGATSSTQPTNPSTGLTTSPFNPDILNLVFLIVSVGFMVLIIIIVVAIIRQRGASRRQYQF